MITLGLSLLLSGCASAPHDVRQTAAEEKDGWTRCPRGQAVNLTVVCLKR
jgi:starvation-inducible outer membrane lipoprotein